MGVSVSKMYQVMEVRNGLPVYHKDALRKMFERGPAKVENGVFVISISGNERYGKSFLLNLLKCYLNYYSEFESADGWIRCFDLQTGEEKEKTAQGFYTDPASQNSDGGWPTNHDKKMQETESGQTEGTHGIWMYMHPELIQNQAIILMDCQGNFDVVESTLQLDNLILFLGLKLADVHIMNLDRPLGTGDIQKLQADVFLTEGSSGEERFNRQVFLLRNWKDPEKVATKTTEKVRTDSPVAQNVHKGIEQAFAEVETLALPYPSACLERDNGMMLDDVNNQFLEAAQELFFKLILRLQTEAHRTSQDFLNEFLLVSKRPVGEICMPQQAYEELQIKKLFQSCFAQFTDEIEKIKSMKSQLDESQMQVRITAVYKETMAKFMDHKIMNSGVNHTLRSEYLGFLEKTYTELQTLIKNMYEVEKLNTLLVKAERDARAAETRVQDIRVKFERSDVTKERKNETVKRKDKKQEPLLKGAAMGFATKVGDIDAIEDSQEMMLTSQLESMSMTVSGSKVELLAENEEYVYLPDSLEEKIAGLCQTYAVSDFQILQDPYEWEKVVVLARDAETKLTEPLMKLRADPRYKKFKVEPYDCEGEGERELLYWQSVFHFDSKTTATRNAGCELMVQAGGDLKETFVVGPAHMLFCDEANQKFLTAKCDIEDIRQKLEANEPSRVVAIRSELDSLDMEPTPMIAYRYRYQKPEAPIPLHKLFTNDCVLFRFDASKAWEIQNNMRDGNLFRRNELRETTSIDDLQADHKRALKVAVKDYKGNLYHSVNMERNVANFEGVHLTFVLTSKDKNGKYNTLEKGDSGRIVSYVDRDKDGIEIHKPWGMLVESFFRPPFQHKLYKAIVLNQAFRDIEQDYGRLCGEIQLYQATTNHNSAASANVLSVERRNRGAVPSNPMLQ